jgi:hypothetical protein
MTNDSITWTGTPDDQRAEWRGMKAYAVWCGPQEWEATVYRGSVKGERLLATLPGRPLPRSVQEAKWLCELVMRHEAAKAELEQAREVNHKLHRRCQQAEADSTCHYAKLFRESQAELERWKRRAELWKRAAKAQMDERRDALWQCCDAVMDKLGIVRKGQ